MNTKKQSKTKDKNNKVDKNEVEKEEKPLTEKDLPKSFFDLLDKAIKSGIIKN